MLPHLTPLPCSPCSKQSRHSLFCHNLDLIREGGRGENKIIHAVISVVKKWKREHVIDGDWGLLQVETLESDLEEMPKEPVMERLGGISGHSGKWKRYLKTRKDLEWGFPGGSVAQSTCQWKRRGFNLWSGKIPCATEQLSPCATAATEPAL